MEGIRQITRIESFATAAPGIVALSVAAMLAMTSGAVLVLTGAMTRPARAVDSMVSIVDFSFQPSTITIDAGQMVTWTVTRAQEPHTVTPVDPQDAFVGSALLRQGDSFAVTFSRVGTYRYQCSIHPEEMQGTIIVVAAAATMSPTAHASPVTPTSAPSLSAVPSPGSDGASEGGPPPTIFLVAALAGTGLLVAIFLIDRFRRRGA